jgi:hypothetical protein
MLLNRGLDESKRSTQIFSLNSKHYINELINTFYIHSRSALGANL